MVFTRIGLGFITGVTISMNCHENIYMFIQTCFVRPHWRFNRIRSQEYTKDHALDVNLLDSYVKDTLGSFALFWVMLIPMCYKTYVQGLDINDGHLGENLHEVEDTYSKMLKNVVEKNE